MENKIFGKKKIKIRKLSEKDLKRAKNFQNFINSLIGEKAQIIFNKKVSLREERKWLIGQLKKIKNKKTVLLIAGANNKIVGTSQINLRIGRMGHIGDLQIYIENGYRGVGLGSFLMKEILKLAEKELKPKPKIIRLGVFPTNKVALSLYKKFGFQKVAKIPEQFEYKGKLIDEIIMLRYL